MPTLPELQVCVMHALLDQSDGAAAAALLRSNGTALAPARRLQIYRNNLYESLGTALGAVYPVVQRLVGPAFFRQMARRFIREHPSRSGNLHRFGAELPQFLRAFEPAAGLPYLPDVAALEWAYHHAYHEVEQPALEPARLAAVAPEQQDGLQLRLQPSARLLASRYPVLRIWQVNQAQAAADGAATNDGDGDGDGDANGDGHAEAGAAATVSLDEGGIALVVVQHALEIEFRRLGAAEHGWLQALAEGHGLGAATQRALALEPSFDLGATLLRHLQRGLFVGFETRLAPRASASAVTQAGAYP